MNTTQLIRKGIRSPGKVPNYLYQKFSSKFQSLQLEAYRRRKSIERQRPLIHEFIENDEFVLVILDACRYDVFNKVYREYITGDLKRVWASGRWTGQYCQRTWTDEYDLTYINSIPVFSDFYFELRDMGFRPSNHISDIVHMWDYEWNPSLGTTPPKEITNEALRHANAEEPTRIVVHYAQPHVPYIGDKSLDVWDVDEPTTGGEIGLRDLLSQNSERPTQVVLNKIRSGEVEIEELKESYRSNVRYVMQEVVRLVQRINCPVVITADHGEHLGEKGYYLHEEDSIFVRQVPWFVVDDSEIGTKKNKEEYKDAHLSREYTGSESEIQDRLRNLGYK